MQQDALLAMLDFVLALVSDCVVCWVSSDFRLPLAFALQGIAHRPRYCLDFAASNQQCFSILLGAKAALCCAQAREGGRDGGREGGRERVQGRDGRSCHSVLASLSGCT